VRQSVIANLGRAEELAASGALASLQRKAPKRLTFSDFDRAVFARLFRSAPASFCTA
jgi:hypothetical protein